MNVCVRERERERERETERERGREGGREGGRERESECVCVCVYCGETPRLRESRRDTSLGKKCFC